MVSKAAEYFKDNKCITAECLIATNKKTYRKVLRRYGFVFKRVRNYFAVHGIDNKRLTFLKNINNWFITDSDPDLEIWL